MKLSLPSRTRRRQIAAATAVLTFSLGLAACGDGSGAASSGAGSGGSSSTDSALAAEVKKLTEPADSFPVPTEAMGDISSLKGKTVYYIPITQQAPSFTVTAAAMKEALAAAGLSLQVCDGGSNPTSISACINQAVGAHTAGIVTDAIPYTMAANALDTAQRAGIPVLIADQIPDAQHAAGKMLAYQEGAGTEMLEAIAKWIVVDSGGSAKVVLTAANDSPSSRAYAAAGEKVIKDCSGCKLTVNEISSANFSLIAPSTSSAILKTPGVNYVISEFDQYVQPVMGGTQQSGKLASVKGASSAATLTSLKMVKSKTFLHAEAAQALPYQGWTLTDAILRMALGQDVPEEKIPYRLFTEDNIDSIELTDAAQASGAWFGPAGFQDDFKKLWGVA